MKRTMQRRRRSGAIAVAAVFAIWAALAVLTSVPVTVRAQGPVGDALATIAAATVYAQQTRAAQDAMFANQRATANAMDLNIRQANAAATDSARATAAAVSGTRSALDTDATRSAIAFQQTRERMQAQATATADALRAESTRVSAAATATSVSLRNDATATAFAVQAEQDRDRATATAAAVTAQAQATATAVALQAQAEARDRSLRTIGLALIAAGAAFAVFSVAILLTWRMWRSLRRPTVARPVVVVEDGAQRGGPVPVGSPPFVAAEVIDIPPPETMPPAPSTRVVFDDDIAREINEILRADRVEKTELPPEGGPVIENEPRD